MHLFRKFIFIVLIGFLLLPIIQSNFHLFKIKPLSGAYIPTKDTTLTFTGWFSGKYQAHEEQFLRDTFGLRNLYIRAHNQINYTLFHKPNAADIVVGKYDNLFIVWYLRAYMGQDFDGTPMIKERMDKLKYIQDKLAEMHKTLLIVFTPSKDLFTPEYLPDTCLKSDSDNYDVCVKLIKEEGLNYIDFNSYFLSIKHTSPYPLYSKYNSHWSAYGSCIAGDSIISKIEKLRAIKMPHTKWKERIVSEEPNDEELGMEKELNLLFPFKHEIMGHPRIQNPPDSSKIKPSLMFIGDSYFWVMAVSYNFGANFSALTFCHYFKTMYLPGTTNSIDADNFNLKDAIQKNDIIIIEATEPNTGNLGWGFADAAFKLFKQD